MTSRNQPIVVVTPERTEYVDRHVTIHEHRAPTDESVALLKRMEEAATDRIIEAIVVGNTQFECVVHRMLDNQSDQMVMRAVFKLNGRKATAEHRFSPRMSEHTDQWVALRDEIATVIATMMIADAMKARR